MTGVTEKLFMCQMSMCLFRPLMVDHEKSFRGETKGRFRKRVVLANVPSFRVFVPGEHANVPFRKDYHQSFAQPEFGTEKKRASLEIFCLFSYV